MVPLKQYKRNWVYALGTYNLAYGHSPIYARDTLWLGRAYEFVRIFLSDPFFCYWTSMAPGYVFLAQINGLPAQTPFLKMAYIMS